MWVNNIDLTDNMLFCVESMKSGFVIYKELSLKMKVLRIQFEKINTFLISKIYEN